MSRVTDATNGIGDLCIASRDAQDPFERQVPGYGLNRDPHRSPMRWTAARHAGFTTGEPWLPVGDEVETRNVEAQSRDATSLLKLYRSLVHLRVGEPLLQVGSYEPAGRWGDILAYRRRLPGRELVVALNFGGSCQEVRVAAAGKLRLSTHLDRVEARLADPLRLRPHEGVVIESLCSAGED
jgi:alpha-glucosidase